MGNVTNHERGGVYSVYEASSVVSGKAAGALVGLAARATAKTPGAVLTLYHYEQAVEELGTAPQALRLIELLMRNGASGVLLAPVGAEADYAGAFAALNEREEVSIVVCDSVEATVHADMKAAVEAAAALRRERIGVVAAGGAESVSQLIARAEVLNSERLVLVAPAAVGEDLPGPALAAAVAGAIAGETDPAVPMGGAVLLGLSDVTDLQRRELGCTHSRRRDGDRAHGGRALRGARHHNAQ